MYKIAQSCFLTYFYFITSNSNQFNSLGILNNDIHRDKANSRKRTLHFDVYNYIPKITAKRHFQ